MAYFKALVSKKKRRFQEDGFDLDLTYIKPNIVAMGFPSDNLEGVYRNHIEEVIRFLETRHKDHYKVYNLCSERQYDPAKFNNRVATYPFDDHNAPPFELIKPFCEDVDLFLNESEQNVAFIHCKAGKGRTGVMICAYLLHNGHFWKTKEALKHYGEARTRNKKGVTIPSQRRYVRYYNHLLTHKLQYVRTMVLLKKIELLSEHTFQNFTFNPFYIVWQQKVKLYQSKVTERKKSSDGLLFELSQPIPICGDIKVEFFYKEMFKKERLLQFWFNTFFISQAAWTKKILEDEPTLQTFELDPELRYFDIGKEDLDKAHKDPRERIFGSDFKIRVTFSEVPMTSASTSASLPRKLNVKPKHKKSRSMDSIETDEMLNPDYVEDDFSDTDNEEEWNKEDHQWNKEDHQSNKEDDQSNKEDDQCNKEDHQWNKQDHQWNKEDHQWNKEDHQSNKEDHQCGPQTTYV
ncbi:phosphatidylinositol 3,4,5-trisphosphate 3-phosphatase and dual-specificity protein phosphatase PTEN-like isoform X2 [Stylophora pistillata]|uniref:phosphatidylinositol 3,4,5-trisphosphate 3-phosphatase and dual-specificity protein phosphatase PTEN-like isoform X2 n=1 Tax=Stylophora pistillata TaxID=50429 RepID=UPI000C0451F5|nr:phosphatidylinositol 3,4,5-trisphosphate 3-phosphatase and dual-specificity protein phosphatase PTEN-like isoform X2 [Stylophora pistillata]XP_022789183.1 phosphatidylinositol 3,4,5-trisphosphate 3-phosphatase and dual-specificity protein phosphatase PTEN-like isoform X2 [Stylophora pistillata]